MAVAERWYVLRSKPRKETSLARYASSLRVEVFLPTIPVRPVNPRASRVGPYFPGYLFVHTDLAQVGQSTFRWMPLSQGLVCVGGEPAFVAEQVVEALRDRVGQIWDAGGLGEARFERGDAVRILGGVFDGYDGIFDRGLPGAERVRILLRMIHDRYVPLDIDPGLIQRRGDGLRCVTGPQPTRA